MLNEDRATLKLAELPALRDIYRVNANLADEELSIATKRYEQALERRDKLRERTRFGLLALNAASLVALLSGLGSEWTTKFGMDGSRIAEVIALFLVGLMAGAIAIWWSGITATRDAASDYEDLLQCRQRKAEYEGAATVEAEAKLLNRTAPEWKTPPDYRWSKIDNLLTNFAGSAWLAAVGAIAWQVAQHANWCLPWCT